MESVGGFKSRCFRGSIHVTPGMRLKYYIPQQGYSFVPEGNPFLVRKGKLVDYLRSCLPRLETLEANLFPQSTVHSKS